MSGLRQVAFPQVSGTILASVLDSLIVVHEELEAGTWHPPRPLEMLTIFVTDAGRAATGCNAGSLEQRPGALVAVAQGTRLSQQVAQSPWRSHYLMLAGTLVGELNSHLQSLPLGAILPQRTERLNYAVRESVAIGLARPSGWEWQLLRHLSELIGGLLGSFSDTTWSLSHRIEHAVDCEPDRTWRVHDLARTLALGHRTLQRQWREEHQVGLARFVLKRRLLHAQLLLNNGLSLSAVASRLNFSSPFHLSRAFKRIHGFSPSEFLTERHSRQHRPPDDRGLASSNP